MIKNILRRFTSKAAAGPLMAHKHGLSKPKDGCFWLQAEPVFLEPDHKRVFMRGNIGVTLEKSDSIKIVKNLNNFLNQDGLELMAVTPIQWILKGKSKSPFNINTHAISDCLDKEISGLLPTGENQAYWRRLLTECQMLMKDYEAEYNINSLWFWGAGESYA